MGGDTFNALVFAIDLIEREMHETCGAVSGPYNETRHTRLANYKKALERLLTQEAWGYEGPR